MASILLQQNHNCLTATCNKITTVLGISVIIASLRDPLTSHRLPGPEDNSNQCCIIIKTKICPRILQLRLSEFVVLLCPTHL